MEPTTGARGPFACLLLSAALAAGALGCSAMRPTPPTPAIPLADAAEMMGRLMGTAIAGHRLSEVAYADAARAEFNYVTPENEMKWDALQPVSGLFTFEAADAVVAFAEQNGMQVKGHTLVWHLQLPTWVTALTNATDVRNAMLSHITAVVTHYRGRVASWDVVNEAWENGMAMRDSVFHQYLGPDYVAEAFQAARAADSTAVLVYNDFAAEGMSAKANAVYTMVADLKARGVPIDGVGMQMHTSPTGGPATTDFVSNVRRLAALGLQVAITEMDVHICTSDLETQRRRYHDLVAACVAEPACNAVSVWGITDKYSWLNDSGRCDAPRPLLFDDTFGKKPAYRGVLEALLGRPVIWPPS
jgi:endo-1,4-beta-xylanase